MKNKAFSFYAGVFVISGMVMVLQILQSRIYSVVSWYHLSFLVISMAMFGLTLGALKIYRGDENEQRENYGLIARKHTMAFGFFILCALFCQLYVPIFSTLFVLTLMTLPVAAIATSVAYYHAGVVITTCLTRSPYPIGRVYGVDLLGAGLGCIVSLLLMEYVGAPTAVLMLSGFAFGSAFLFPVEDNDQSRTVTLGATTINLKKTAQIFFACTFVLGVVNIALPMPFIYPVWIKDNVRPMHNFSYVEWNSISRVTVEKEAKKTPFLWGPSPNTPWKELGTQLRMFLTIDGDAGTPITKFDGDFSKHRYLDYDVVNLAYSMPGIKNAAIIGVGGGRDLLSSKYFGVKNVTALDVNPVQIKLLKDNDRFRNYSNLYKLPGVTILNEEARSWFRHNTKKVDIVQMSLIDTWAATGAGAFALSENGLYTVEAWETFMHSLSDHGVFTVSRWSSYITNDTGRLLSVAMATLFKQGVKDPRAHIVLANSGNIATLILSKSPFSKAQLDAIREKAKRMDFKLILLPGQPDPEGILGTLLQAKNIEDLHKIADTQAYDVSPAVDMRPFFFNQARLTNPLGVIHMILNDQMGGVEAGQAKATINLYVIILFSIAMVAFVIINPLRKTIEDKTSLFVRAGTLYFVLIGLGFMLIEISMLQALGVFLGHPIYGLSVLLFSLILSAGIGSLLSDRLPLRDASSRIVWCLCVFAYGYALSHMMSDVFHAHEDANIFQRVLISIAMITPAGVLMGFGFPTGLSITEKFDKRATAWFWGINGAAGVMGSSFGIAMNIALGIDWTLFIGACCYALLTLCFIAFQFAGSRKIPA